MKKLLSLPLLAAAALLGLAGCDTKTASNGVSSAPAEALAPEAQAKALEDSLMVHHERAMGQADELIALAATLQQQPTPPRPLLARIQAADNAMMTWMHQSHDHAPDSAAPATQRVAYLRDQQRQLSAIEQQLKATIDSAQATLRRRPATTAPVAPATR